MSVDSVAAAMDAPLTDTAGTAVVDNDAALDAVWEKHNTNNGSERAADGKFSSPGKAAADADQPQGEDRTEPLEGGGGEDAGDTESTPQSTVPLPSSMRHLEDVWSKIPDDLKKPLADHQNKLHKTLSDQGQALASWKPVRDTIEEFKDYFGGDRGNYDPAEAIKELFTIQKAMDDNPLQTILDISKRYNLIPHLAQVFAPKGEGGENGQPSAAGKENAALLAEISELKSTINDLRAGFKPELIDERISQRLIVDREESSAMEAINRTSNEMPLRAEISADDWKHYISRSWTRLGEAASKEAVLKSAYDMAVNADPDLRARTAALKGAAVNDAAKVADAKRANATNLRSTSTGKPRELTEDEILSSVWDKFQRA